jgi:hypothetical protein
VTIAEKKRKTPAYRLWYDSDLGVELKNTFVMSYMRTLEKKLRPHDKEGIEKEIPFLEFIDIEFDHTKKLFRFVAHYRQEPSFPELFKRFISSPKIDVIDDEVNQEDQEEIYKQSWKNREMLEFELGAQNVIYMLIDTDNKLLYIGEALDLEKRLSQKNASIPNWNYYRYDVLPPKLSDYRVPLKDMLNNIFAEILEDERWVEFMKIHDFDLANADI